ALLRRGGVGRGVLLVERQLVDHLGRTAATAAARRVLRGRLIGLVLVAGKRRRRRHVGLRDVTAAATTNGSVGVRLIPLVRRRVRRGVLLAAGLLDDRLARRLRPRAAARAGPVVGRVGVRWRARRAGQVDRRV